MAKEKKTGMGGKSFLGGELKKKSAVQQFASTKEEPVEEKKVEAPKAPAKKPAPKKSKEK
mgnify:CR=1 FL=1